MFDFLLQIQRRQKIAVFDITKDFVKIATCGFKPAYVPHFP